MIKEDLNMMDYQQFIKEYVISPLYEVTISFSYKDKYYQFDFVGVPKNPDGSIAYDFVFYDKHWDSERHVEHYRSLKEAIEKARIEGMTFEEVYNSPESEIIDIS